MIKLRPYQNKIVGALRAEVLADNKRLIMAAPTGAGKTIMFTYMVARHIEKGGKALIFTHRRELLKQAGGTFAKFGLSPVLIEAGRKTNTKGNLFVGMVETVARRLPGLAEFVGSCTLIIFDEAHLETFNKIFPSIAPGAVVIGATATPYRKGKAATALGDFYQALVQEVDVPDLIASGHLCAPKSYGVEIDLTGAKRKQDEIDVSEIYEKNRVFEGVVSNWERIAKHSKTLLFAANIGASMRVAREFNERGYYARHIDGNTKKKEREEILAWFDNDPKAIVCNCGVLTAGFDQPDIKTIILYRATTSLPLFLQMVGRGSRLAEGKEYFNILDFGMNIPRLGYWEKAREWSLDKIDAKAKEGPAPTKICDSCGGINPVSVKNCLLCGAPFVKTEEEEEAEHIAELKLLDPAEVRKMAAQMEVAEQVKLAKNGLVNANFLLHRMKKKEDALLFIKLMGYSPGWLHYNKHRFKVFK